MVLFALFNIQQILTMSFREVQILTASIGSFLNIATSFYISLHDSWYKMVFKFKIWWSAKLSHEHHEPWQINSMGSMVIYKVPAFQKLSKICKTEEISSIKCWFSWSGWFLGKAYYNLSSIPQMIVFTMIFTIFHTEIRNSTANPSTYGLSACSQNCLVIYLFFRPF